MTSSGFIRDDWVSHGPSAAVVLIGKRRALARADAFHHARTMYAPGHRPQWLCRVHFGSYAFWKLHHGQRSFRPARRRPPEMSEATLSGRATRRSPVSRRRDRRRSAAAVCAHLHDHALRSPSARWRSPIIPSRRSDAERWHIQSINPSLFQAAQQVIGQVTRQLRHAPCHALEKIRQVCYCRRAMHTIIWLAARPRSHTNWRSRSTMARPDEGEA